ncbi:MAG TPA: ABC transporter ATP-binding protein [Tepidisphaeraceae bacterium]|jgi:ABC-2 type transport system ATP-binding protein|nr:ABC transporter ATP-binding protein [Tepidisphaeraceae bacterium]
MTPPPHLLEVKNLRVRFGNLLAVRDASFSLPPSTLLGLIGPNGAGKTTLLRAIAGLQPLTRGSISLLGVPLSSDISHQIGFTPDVPPVYDELTVRQFLQFVGKGYDLPSSEIRERSDFWLEKVWLADKANSKIKTLSRGMKQRIGIARTLLPNPALVLLDEPASGLDPAGRVQFRQLLIDLRDQGKTIIISSHILADMDEYCTHIAIISAGAVHRFGTVSEISSGQDSARRRYLITLAHPVSNLTALLSTLPDIAAIEVDRERATFEYPSTPDAAAAALSHLVTLKIPISSFAPVAANLEEAYLRAGIRQVD